jgi:hypothetical protein
VDSVIYDESRRKAHSTILLSPFDKFGFAAVDQGRPKKKYRPVANQGEANAGNKTHGHVHQQQSSPRAILPADFRNGGGLERTGK